MTTIALESYRLSPHQRRLWRLLKRGEVCRTEAVVGIEGTLDTQRLRTALHQVVGAHEILHTSFQELAGGVPSQTIEPPASDSRWVEAELAGGAAQRPQSAGDWPIEEVWRFLRQSGEGPAGDASWRIYHFPLAADRHALLFSFPSLCADARSLQNLLKELVEAYGSGTAEASEPMQYADFSEWQNELGEEDDEDGAAGRAFWEELAARDLPALTLPWSAATQEPEVSGGLGLRHYDIVLDGCEELTALATRWRTGLEELLLAGWQALVWRLSGQADTVVGWTFDGRKYAELQSALGLYACSLPIHSKLGAEITFDELLQSNERACRDASSWQEYFPAEDIDSPAMGFELIELPAPRSAGGATFHLLDQRVDIERFDLKLTCLRGPRGLHARLSYDPRRLSAAGVGVIGRGLATLHGSLARRQDGRRTRLDDLEIAAPQDRRRLHGGSRGLEPSAVVHQLVERQAADKPDAEALVCDGVEMTYEQLEQRAEELAQALLQRGVTWEEPVALGLDRSLDMVVAQLAVLKAGAAYVALDPQAPIARLLAIAEDVGARWLITRQSLAGRLPRPAAGVLMVDRYEDVSAARSAGNAGAAIDPDQLAYFAYTSGSSGRPKGVLSHHRGVVNFLGYLLETTGLSDADTVLQLAPLAFDASVRDIMGPLAAGARVIIPTDDEIADPATLLELIREHQVSALLSAVPTMLRGLLRASEEADDGVMPSVRWVLSSGEALYSGDAARIYRSFPEARLLNQYGPTEATMISTFERVEAVDVQQGDDRRPISIGGPIAVNHLELMNGALRSQPQGVEGEILLGGAGIARGYLRRPARTAAAFVPDPHGENLGARLYRTGDLGCLADHGRLSFRGRRDQQVKIHGVRVEPGEVETVLARHESVREAAVVSFDNEGEILLVGYVSIDKDRPVTERALRRFAYERLPAAMLPTRIICFESRLPRTTSGKLDRGALPAPDARPKMASAAPSESNPVEELLSGIMARILGRDTVEVWENFFELGGHSLLATQVMARIQETFDVELPLRTLFEAATVTDLAPLVRSAMARGGRAPVIAPVAREAHLPVSFAQQRLWFLSQLDPDDYSYAVPRLVRMRGQLDIVLLQQALNEIVARHETLRTTIRMIDDEPRQVIAPSEAFLLPVVDLGGLPAAAREAERERLSQRISRQAFDLEHGPLMRVLLMRFEDRDHAAIFVLHHIICDAWSMGVLAGELSLLYGAFLRGEPSPLPALRVQYADFSIWQRQQLAGDPLERHVEYWRRQLGGGTGELRLPIRPDAQEVRTTHGARYAFSIPPEVSATLRTLAGEQGATLFMVLLAALKVFLRPYVRGQRLTVGTDIANRTQPGIESLIGFFVNLLVLVTEVRSNLTFKEFIARVRGVALQAYAHQDLPFEKLVEELQPERSEAGGEHFFQVLFVLQNARRTMLEMPGLDLEHVWIDNQTAKFDLLLNMFEGDEGLSGVWNYPRDLFEETTVVELSTEFVRLLTRIAEQPDARLSQLEPRVIDSALPTEARRQSGMEKTASSDSKLEMFMKMQPKAVKVSSESLVRTRTLDSGKLPLVIEPAGGDVSLADWAKSNRQLLEDKLLEHGAILFRGFGVDSLERFQRFCETQCSELFGEYGDLPHESVSSKIYSSTPYPPEERILYHNESSQMNQWPRKQFFCCIIPAAEGGETPIADCRQIYQKLDPRIRDRFQQLKLMYTRNFTDGLDVSLSEFFQTEDREEIERFCRQERVEYEWLEDSHLRTRKICPGVVRHPKTGESLFFNQIQAHHMSYLKPENQESMMSLFGDEENLPRNVFFGDGSRIDQETTAEILKVYDQNAVSFAWEKGDVLMVDNMLVAHSRNAFKGPRQLLVAMGEMVSIDEVDS